MPSFIRNILFNFRNNTLDISLFECTEKQNFAFDKVDSTPSSTLTEKYDKEAYSFAARKMLKSK